MGKYTDQPRNPPARPRPLEEAADPTGDSDALTLALREALDRQTATTEILHAIARSPENTVPLLDTIARAAQCLLAASGAAIDRVDNEGALHRVATSGLAAPVSEFSGMEQDRGTVMSYALSEKRTIHVEDVLTQAEKFSNSASVRGKRGNRTILATPLMRENEAIGAINVSRKEVRPFTSKEIELLESFADQAVIAIENARLMEELNARNHDLAESLEQQGATSEVLRAIASSPGDADGVLQTIAKTAGELFKAWSANILLADGGIFRDIVGVGPHVEVVRTGLQGQTVGSDTVAGRAIQEKRVVQIPNVQGSGLEIATAGNFARTVASAPLLREGEALGAISIAMPEVRPFTAGQLDLLQSFADQAVIAIENARLMNELRESLAQQTAISEVLGVIASNAGDPTTAINKICQTAARLFGASSVGIRQLEGQVLRYVGAAGTESSIIKSHIPDLHLDEPSLPSSAVLKKTQIHIDDYDKFATQYPLSKFARAANVRASVATPLLHNGSAIGVLTVNRTEPKPFTDVDLQLIGSFADQTVIAIETARLLDELNTRNRDLAESLEQQMATSEILRTIARSPGEAERVLDTIARTAQCLLAASGASIMRVDGEVVRRVAAAGVAVPAHRTQRRLGRDSPGGRATLEKRTIHINDVLEQTSEFSSSPAVLGQTPARTILATPLMREGEAIGAIIVIRSVVQPFAPKQIELLESFAAQAVIAIENARLLDELNTRNRDLAESLEHQTATSEILRTIASSPAEAERALDKIAQVAARMFDAAGVNIRRVDGAHLRVIGSAGAITKQMGAEHPDIPLDRSSIIGNAVLEGRLIHVADPSQPDSDDEIERQAIGPLSQRFMQAGRRTTAAVPLLREGTAIGGMVVVRTEIRPFTEPELALLQSFADQTVIAIENARLLTELRESLDRQTATSEVLRTISSSAGNLESVYSATLENATRVCAAQAGVLWRFSSGQFSPISMIGIPPAYADFLRRRDAQAAHADLPIAHVARSKKAYHLLDAADCTPYHDRDPVAVAAVELGGIRTVLTVPLVRENEVIGAMAIYRQETRFFTDKQVELVENFADQAVIAIENARLVNELSESLERRTATAEVLSVISSSPGEVKPVFEAMLDNAVRLCDATNGSVFAVSSNALHRVASRGLTAEVMGHNEIPFVPGTPIGRMRDTLKSVHTPDLLAELEQKWAQQGDSPDTRAAQAVADRGIRSVLWVPMVKDTALVGAFVLNRPEPRPFTEAQIALVETFASQAVIAIENARLLDELRSARDDAEQALEELKTAQASLIQSEKMASLGQLTAGIAHEIKNPLNFVNNFANISVELLDELKELIGPAVAALDDDKRADFDELVEMLTGNLEKVSEHGRRADGIVKSMLAHSRGGSGDRQSVNLNLLIEEALNLAYHGARAQDQSFNVTMERDLDPTLPPLEVVPQNLMRVFLNLFGNGFYAANKRLKEGGDAKFQPTLKVSTEDDGRDVIIRIRDNGVGIPPAHRERLFEPFFTTKPTGEGTGLGLSISYDIVTKEHGGAIEVESEPNAFTAFTIRIPKTRVIEHARSAPDQDEEA